MQSQDAETSKGVQAPPAKAQAGPSPRWRGCLRPLPLMLLVFSFFMLTGSRERPWSDATPIYQVAESIVHDGSFAIEVRWPHDLPNGVDGKIYAVAPLLQSLVHVPGVMLRDALGKLDPETMKMAWPFAAHFGPAVLSAWLAWIFWCFSARFCSSLGARVAALVFMITGTSIWVYGRSPYGEILQALGFLWLFAVTLSLEKNPTAGKAVALGLAAGVLLNTKMVYILTLPGVALFVAYHLRHDRRTLLRTAAIASAAFVPVFCLLLFYNQARWGSVTQAGYDLDRPVFVERPLAGLWGLFLSPGKSVFLYSPVLLLSVVALPRFWRRHRQAAILIAATIVPVLALYSRFLFWSGDYAWGPRYLVFALPVLFIPGVVLLDDLLKASWARWGAIAPVAVAGIFAFAFYVQILGNAFHWDHFIRISMEARNNWLGWPNKNGAANPPINNICGACFEDAHPVQWLPPFSPIDGHHWLLRHVWQEHNWQEAQGDAPWKRYTSLDLNISNTYPRARLDHWYFNFRDSHRTRSGMALFCLFGLGTLVGGGLFVRQARKENTAQGA